MDFTRLEAEVYNLRTINARLELENATLRAELKEAKKGPRTPIFAQTGAATQLLGWMESGTDTRLIQCEPIICPGLE